MIHDTETNPVSVVWLANHSQFFAPNESKETLQATIRLSKTIDNDWERGDLAIMFDI